MRCKKFGTTASAYLDSQLSDDEMAEYRAHLLTCAGCSLYLAEINSASRMLKDIEEPELPRELHSYIMTTVRRRTAREISPKQRAIEWLLKLNPLPVSYATGALVSAVLFAFTMTGIRPIPVIGSTGEQGIVLPPVPGTDLEFHAVNDLPPDAEHDGVQHDYYLPRVLNNSSLVSFSHLTYLRLSDDGMKALVEVSPDGHGKLVEMLEDPNDPYLVEQLWWSLNQRAFQPATVDGRAVLTKVVMFIEKMDVRG